MADGYWNGQHQQQQQLQQGHPSAGLLKRPRTDYELPPSAVPSSHAMHNYLLRDDGRDVPQAVKDTKSIGSAYDRYLQDAQRTSFSSGEASSLGGAGLGRTAGQAGGGGMPGFPARDHGTVGRSSGVGSDLGPRGRDIGYDGLLPLDHVAVGRSSGVGSDLGPRRRDISYDGLLPLDAPNGRGMGFDDRFPVDAPSGRLAFEGRRTMDDMPRGNRDTLPLSPDASNTLYVEGLPPNCTKREVAHIFRPFVGYKEVRLVSKESKHRGGDPLILCFVDFINPACAATALSALQGYKMDEHDPDSAYLRLQFSRYPGPRSTAGPRGKR